ncbi:right-handed parallel beta-helix repeat-containing protein [Enterobacter sp. UPMP2052]
MNSFITAQESDVMKFIPEELHDEIYARTSNTDVSRFINDAISNLSPYGGELNFPAGKFKVNKTITVDLKDKNQLWRPVVMRGAGSTEIDATELNGILIDDKTGNLHFSHFCLNGPLSADKYASLSIGIKSTFGLGEVTNCLIGGFWFGLDVSGTTGGFISRNRITGCQEGIHCSRYPDFSNVLNINKNYLDFNVYGMYIENSICVTLDGNCIEWNDVGLYLKDVKKYHLRGGNWFEKNKVAGIQSQGNSSGNVDEDTQFVGNGDQ